MVVLELGERGREGTYRGARPEAKLSKAKRMQSSKRMALLSLQGNVRLMLFLQGHTWLTNIFQY